MVIMHFGQDFHTRESNVMHKNGFQSKFNLGPVQIKLHKFNKLIDVDWILYFKNHSFVHLRGAVKNYLADFFR